MVSIIIPAHNEEKYIEETLKSVLNQNCEIIVVANGCKDKTVEKVKKFPKVKLYEIKEAHVSKARNYGASKTKEELLIFVDADTKLSSNSIQTIIKHFDKKTVVATTLSKPDINKFKFKFGQNFKNFVNKTHLFKGCSGVLICRRKDFEKVGGFPILEVREPRKLILKLLKLGKYKCIKTYSTTSMRRFEQWGLIKVIFYWVKEWFKDHFLGTMKKTKYERVR
jgi:glycosyltransferase involved in cell wall biosynthesis